jgi:hypothetical protein
MNAGLHFRIPRQFHEFVESEAWRDRWTYQGKRVRNNFRRDQINLRLQSCRQIRGSLQGRFSVLKICEHDANMKFWRGFGALWGEYLVCRYECGSHDP